MSWMWNYHLTSDPPHPKTKANNGQWRSSKLPLNHFTTFSLPPSARKIAAGNFRKMRLKYERWKIIKLRSVHFADNSDFGRLSKLKFFPVVFCTGPGSLVVSTLKTHGGWVQRPLRETAWEKMSRIILGLERYDGSTYPTPPCVPVPAETRVFF